MASLESDFVVGDTSSSPGRKDAPFFIVGAGRSGTTLLRLIIAGHTAIEIPPETWFILPLVSKFSLKNRLTRDEVVEVANVMVKDYRWPDMEIEPDALLKQALSLNEPTLVDIVNIVYERYLERAKKRRLGDKTPPYIEIVPQLSELYPGAKFIHLVRDGRDVAISYIDLWWHGNCRYYEPDFDWTRALRFREKYAKTALDRSILDVKYEDLLSDPEFVVRKICDFLGEAFEPEMLDVSPRVDKVPERERVIHPKLAQPLSTEAIGRWRVKLSALECFLMEACLRKNLRKWGYSLRFSSLGWRPFLAVAGWVLLAVGPVLAKGVRYLQRRNYLPKTIYI
jgi:hypothetical protein